MRPAIRKSLWIAPLTLLALLLIALAWLLLTEAGLQWAYETARARLPGTLELQALDGRLAGRVEIRGLRYRDTSVDIRIERAVVDWAPLALLIGRLEIEELTLERTQIALTESKEKRERGALSIPLAVRVSHVDIRDLSVQRTGQAAYDIHRIELAGQISDSRASIEHLRVEARHFHVEANGALGMTRGDEQLQVRWRVAPPSLAAIAGEGRITGNLQALSLSQRITEPVAATVNATLDNVLSSPQWRVDVDFPQFALSQLTPSARDARLAGSINASGKADRFSGSGAIRAHYADSPEVAGRFKFHGNAAEQLTLEDVVLTVAGTETQVTAQAHWDRTKATWQAQAKWQQLAWPLTGTAMVTSANGQLRADGTAQSYQMTLDAITQGSNLPEMRWHISGNGNATQARSEKMTIDTLGGTLRGAASVHWSPSLRWSAQLQGNALDPAVAWPQWPGALAVNARLSGDAQQLRAEINELHGTLRGYPLRAQASATRRGEHYPALALQLQSGDLRAQIEGAIGKQWDLSWRLDAPTLAAALPGATGRLSSTGQLRGARAAPQLRAQLSATGLAYQGARARELQVDAALDLSDRTRSRLKAHAVAGRWQNHEFERIAVEGEGLLSDHTFSAAASVTGVAFNARLAGRYAKGAWRGMLDDSTLTLNTETWKLSERTALLVGTDHVELGNACWQAPSTARVCAKLQRATTGTTTIGVTAERVPLALVSPLLPTALTLRGTLNGNAHARVRAGRALDADVHLDVDRGSITLGAPASTTLAYEHAKLRVALDANGMRATAQFALPNGDRGDADIALPGFQPDTDHQRQPLKGRLTLALRDLSPFAALTPELSELQGSLSADLTLGGTLADPGVQGRAELTNAAARIPALGIRVHETRVTLLPAGKRSLRVSGYARSGDGELGLSGEFFVENDLSWRAEVRVAGAHFLALDLPEASVRVSPDLRAHIAPGRINVTGEVTVPEARFAPRQRRGTVAVSRDVVIVNAPEQEAPAPSTPWNISAEVRVILGDQVTLEGYGLSARITGSVVVVDTPGQVTTARGELRVAQGKYETYGQKLDLERGRLLFIGGPVTNPGIDARAVRRADTVTAGVEVKGTLQAPQLTLFSEPPMGQADALSYLLFGKSAEGADASQGRALAGAARALRLVGGEKLAQSLGARFGIEEVEIESGGSDSENASLVLGKRLSPRLYINYSIGLVEQSNVFRIRYQLSQRWSLEALSGTNQSGGDLLFTIER